MDPGLKSWMSDWKKHPLSFYGALPDAGTGCFGTIQALDFPAAPWRILSYKLVGNF
jgi:hypothetical protein